MRSRALVVGSIAYDIVFEVHNNFRNEIILEQNQLKSVSMMLTAKDKQIYFGGTGGNIAYGLGIQGTRPYLFSVVGKDFAVDYKEHLLRQHVELKVIEKPEGFTATFYAISDQNKEQIGIFQPNTHGEFMDKIKFQEVFKQEEMDEIKVAIFSPGTGESMCNHIAQFREIAGLEPIVIFDPSQIVSIFFTKETVTQCLKMSNIIIGNETEIAQFPTILGLSLHDIFELGINYIVETKGADGSIIHGAKEKIIVKAEPVKNFVEQTGAGDAYRAGFIKGLLDDLPIAKCAELGSIMGAKNVQTAGGQTYHMDN